MKLSIITCGKNDNYAGNFIQRLQHNLTKLNDNIIRLNTTDIEVIIVDWGSEEKISDILDTTNFKHINFLYVPDNICKGYSPDSNFSIVHALNAGFRRSKGDYIFFMDGDGYVPFDSLKATFDLIKDKFFFVDIPPPDNTIENILNSFSNIMEKEDLFGLCIDPILKVTTSKNMSERDDKLAAHLGMYCVEYARDNNVCLNITIHQVTPVMDERKMYPIPNLYKVRGGGSLGDGIDNCLFVQRPNYAQDKLDTSVIVGSQKIKKQKLVGVPGAINIQFDRKTNRYKTEDDRDMFNFNKFRP